MSTYWDIEIPIIVRNLINDLDCDNQSYSDSRIKQLILVAANYVTQDVNLTTKYSIDIINESISPDPCNNASRDIVFITFLALKSACMLDQSTFRTKAISEGIKTSLGSASLSVAGNLDGYKTLLQIGPCKTYEDSVMSHNVGDATAISAILSPFVGNKFDPEYLFRGHHRGSVNNFLT